MHDIIKSGCLKLYYEKNLKSCYTYDIDRDLLVLVFLKFEGRMTKNVLMIEDNPNNARLVKRILESNTVRVTHAWDGETGLQMVMEEHPDLILLDLGLPDLDGQTVASFIRRIPELEHIPMIAVTAWPEETARQMVTAYGCDDYISKPIDAKSFKSKVMALLADSQNT